MDRKQRAAKGPGRCISVCKHGRLPSVEARRRSSKNICQNDPCFAKRLATRASGRKRHPTRLYWPRSPGPTETTRRQLPEAAAPGLSQQRSLRRFVNKPPRPGQLGGSRCFQAGCVKVRDPPKKLVFISMLAPLPKPKRGTSKTHPAACNETMNERSAIPLLK